MNPAKRMAPDTARISSNISLRIKILKIKNKNQVTKKNLKSRGEGIKRGSGNLSSKNTCKKPAIRIIQSIAKSLKILKVQKKLHISF